MLSEIHEDRCGKSVQENVIHSIVHSFVLAEQYKKKNPLTLYENMFEEKMLKETGEYYRLENGDVVLMTCPFIKLRYLYHKTP